MWFEMGYTSNAKFSSLKFDPFNAEFSGSKIRIGKETITLETLIHEIAELETLIILDKLKIEDKGLTIEGYQNNVAHFVSPFGEKSFLNPCLELKGKPKSETFLEEQKNE